jgi:hypothetical protein
MLQIWPLEVMRSRQIPQIRSLNTVSSRHALDVVTVVSLFPVLELDLTAWVN